MPIFLAVLMRIGTPLVAYPVLRRFGKLARPDAASIAAHYGSVSVVTFAVGASYLTRQGVAYEGFMSVFLVFLEFPALIIGVLLAKGINRDTRWLLSADVRLEILCQEEVAQRIVEMIVTKYSDNYGLVVYMLDVETRRSNKF